MVTDEKSVELTVLRREKSRLVSRCVRLTSLLDDAKSEIRALRRSVSLLKKNRARDIADAKESAIKELLDQVAEG